MQKQHPHYRQRNSEVMFKRISGFLAVAALILIAACDTLEPGAYVSEYIVESYQIAGEPLQNIHLTKTGRVDLVFDVTAQAVRNAEVKVQLLGQDDGIEETYPYAELAEEPGVYAPSSSDLVFPLRKYRLEVNVSPSDAPITAITLVPDTFTVVEVSATSIVYLAEQLQLRMTRSYYPGRQTYYIFRTVALEPRRDQALPITLSILEQDEESSLEDFADIASPIFNEQNYTAGQDGTISLRYPWIAASFFGPNRIIANALDDNLYDFIRSQTVQQGGSTLSPGEIPNVLTHIEGGRGVFGSYARQILEIDILRPTFENGNTQ